ncbi:ATP-binding domain-containing protein [Methylorubrum sp. SL192]|uniref:ATP-binding domain-containing protein n=1 Tax=Methylorubrum sp. SL192 TaxID=2995167 RepID=UPI0022751188|nr:ATP-binding domain-containing protein [Methylorubrum sp. SL192]MCY1644777.1 ATP-binding domain-containing protein [Methylorubrum sp. SL192]
MSGPLEHGVHEGRAPRGAVGLDAREVRVGKGSPFALTTDRQIEDFCEGTLSWICRQPVSHEDYAAWWSTGQWRDGALIDRKPPNPIIRMSMDIREGRKLEYGTYGDSRVIPHGTIGQKAVLGAGIVLAGKNQTRRDLNTKIRALHGRDSAHPLPGDRLVCLRNNKDKKLLNGGLWDVHSVPRIKPIGVEMLVTSDDTPETTPTEVFVRHEYFAGREDGLSWEQRKFTDEFTYGYCLTVHKSQGSQWDDVVLYDESSTFRDEARRWLYTGVTRAAERVTVVA